MYKKMRLCGLFLLTLLVTLSLTACGEKEIPEGTYTPTKVILADGTEQVYEDYVVYYLTEELQMSKDDPLYQSLYDFLHLTYTFGKEGEVSRTIGTYEDQGSYTREGKTLTLQFNEVTIEGAFDSSSDTVTLKSGDDSGVSVVLSHQD